MNPVAVLTDAAERQVEHWALAASRLNLDDLASSEAWNHLERYLGVSLRRHLQCVIDRLVREADVLVAVHRAARDPMAIAEAHRRLLAFRRQYLRTETTLDFFADAINARTNPRLGGLLRACDTLAYRSMADMLDQLGKTTPVALTYLDQGLGASILKAGLRLWDGGNPSPVAAIKIVRHNLLRPTSLIHEAGHQVAHLTGWNEELSQALSGGLGAQTGPLSRVWAGWASEIAADAFAFVHTGFASVAALHDVVGGEASTVFAFAPDDPHPVSYLRVLLGVEMCRYFYGKGPWDDLAFSWNAFYAKALTSPTGPAAECRTLVRDSLPLLPRVVALTLDTPLRGFGGRPLRAMIRPERVGPEALDELERRIGPALFTSAHWLWSEPLRIVALLGLAVARKPREMNEILGVQEQCMLRLGGALQAA